MSDVHSRSIKVRTDMQPGSVTLHINLYAGEGTRWTIVRHLTPTEARRIAETITRAADAIEAGQ